MHKSFLVAVIFAAVTLSGCKQTSAPAPGATNAPAASPAGAALSGASPAFDEQLRKAAGSGASNCGRVAGNADVTSATDCAIKANQDKKPFYVAYDLPGMSVGVAGNAQGKLTSVNYSADAYKPEQARNAELSNGNHVIALPCPAALRVAQSGRVTCFPPASAPGASPHGGGMGMVSGSAGGGMMSAPPGTPNPHGGKVPPKTAPDK